MGARVNPDGTEVGPKFAKYIVSQRRGDYQPGQLG